MKNRTTVPGVMTLAIGLLVAHAANAFDFGNMMNPSKWMGNKDRYDDDYYDRGYGYPGYGYGPGYAPGGYYGGAPGYGYGVPAYGGAPAYGYGVAPDYATTPGATVAPAYGGANGSPATSSSDANEQIERLQERIRALEEAARQQQQPAAATSPAWGNYQPGYATPQSGSTDQSGTTNPAWGNYQPGYTTPQAGSTGQPGTTNPGWGNNQPGYATPQTGTPGQPGYQYQYR